MGAGVSAQQKAQSHDQLIASVQGHTDGINCMALSENGFLLVTAGDDQTAKVWDARTDKNFRHLGNLVGHTGYITCILIEGFYILTGSSDKTVIKWDVENDFRIAVVCRGHVSVIQRIISTGLFIFTSSFDHSARCYEFETGQCLRVYRGHKRGVFPLLFIPIYEDDILSINDSEENELGVLITGSADGTAMSWNSDTGRRLQIFKGHLGPVTSLVSDEKRIYLFTGSTDSTMRQWLLKNGECVRVFYGHSKSVVCLEMSGEDLFSGSADGTCRQWNICSDDSINVMKGHCQSVSCMKVQKKNTSDSSKNKRFLFSASGDSTVRMFDVDNGKTVSIFKGHSKNITSMKIHGDRLFTASYDGSIKQWWAYSAMNIKPL